MSFAPNQDAKEQIRQATDIVDLVGSYLPLRRQGRNFVALCPWHDDTRPSLQVNPDRQYWKCWVCNIGGDVFNFVMQREGVEFREALQMLADRAGISLASSPRRAAGGGGALDKRVLYQAVAWAETQYSRCLMESAEAEPARRYLSERGIGRESWQRFHLGFAPQNWQWLLDRARSTPFGPEILEAAGLVSRKQETGRYYDFFRNRVMFSIRDSQQRPIAFGGRVLPGSDDPRKYVNTRETRLFSKNEHLYGLDLARDAISRTRQVILVEGYTDVIMAHQHGLANAVAVLGTALGPNHVRLLRRYGDTIVLVLDGDEAGRRRADEVLDLFVASDVDLRILTLPSGADPCDYLMAHGGDALEQLIATAPDAFEHAIARATEGIDLLRDTHRANVALERLLAIMARAPRVSTDPSSASQLRHHQVLVRLAREFHLDESVLRERLSVLRRRSGRAAPAPEKPASEPVRLDPSDRELLEILVGHPELVENVLSELDEQETLVGEARQIMEAFRRVADRGDLAEFPRVLAEVEDVQLKHLLVDLDDSAQRKEPLAGEDAAVRLQRLIDRIRIRSQLPQTQAQLAALEQEKLSEEEEQRILQQLFQHKLVEQQTRR